MAEQSKLDVSKWQAGRPQWSYTPVMWFFYRMIEVAFLDAQMKVRVEGPLLPNEAPIYRPADEALLSRDWIARSEALPAKAPREYVSFPDCCQMLGLKVAVERVALLDVIDRAIDFDEDESWARLEDLSAREPEDDVEPLFNALRVVPALDQLCLFAA